MPATESSAKVVCQIGCIFGENRLIMHSIEHYRTAFISYLDSRSPRKEPSNLYEPIHYILGLGGKRLRPVLTLMAAEIFDTEYTKALDAALAIEVFHNFSLVHDDIMDSAPLRRGKLTVHEKWDMNTGILSGDAMLISAYRYLENYETDTFKHLVQLFSKTALQVCEGQQYDVDFETRDDVTIPEYLKMIEYKTAVLVAAALQMGGVVAGASIKEQEDIYQFGRNLGIAFQLQDDYLDAFGDPKTFGKQVGGDIMANKKTFLYLTALDLAQMEQKRELEHLFSIYPTDASEKINTAKDIFQQSGAIAQTQDFIATHTKTAFDILEDMEISNKKKDILKNLGQSLVHRQV